MLGNKIHTYPGPAARHPADGTTYAIADSITHSVCWNRDKKVVDQKAEDKADYPAYQGCLDNFTYLLPNRQALCVCRFSLLCPRGLLISIVGIDFA